MPTYAHRKDPESKADLINKIMARDFSGNLEDLAANKDLEIVRIAPNAVRLRFGTSGKQFDLIVKMPRSEAFKEQARERWLKRTQPTVTVKTSRRKVHTQPASSEASPTEDAA